MIVDDFSKDNSCKVIESYIDRCNRELVGGIIFIRHDKNIGITKTANDTFRNSKGEYIKPFASDDILLPDAICRLLECIEGHRECSVIVGNAERIEDTYKYNDSYEKVPVVDAKSLNECEDLFESLLFNNSMCAIGEFYRKEIFSQYGYFDETLTYEVLDFWLTVSRK